MDIGAYHVDSDIHRVAEDKDKEEQNALCNGIRRDSAEHIDDLGDNAGAKAQGEQP